MPIRSENWIGSAFLLHRTVLEPAHNQNWTCFLVGTVFDPSGARSALVPEWSRVNTSQKHLFSYQLSSLATILSPGSKWPTTLSIPMKESRRKPEKEKSSSSLPDTPPKACRLKNTWHGRTRCTTSTLILKLASGGLDPNLTLPRLTGWPSVAASAATVCAAVEPRTGVVARSQATYQPISSLRPPCFRPITAKGTAHAWRLKRWSFFQHRWKKCSFSSKWNKSPILKLYYVKKWK